MPLGWGAHFYWITSWISWITDWYWQHYLCMSHQLESWCQNLQLWSISPSPMNWSSSMFLRHWMLGWRLCVQNTHSDSLPILSPSIGRQLGDTRLGIDLCLPHILDWLNILDREEHRWRQIEFQSFVLGRLRVLDFEVGDWL